MIDWKILDDNPMPDGEEDGSSRRKPPRWTLPLLILLLLAGGIMLWRLVDQQQQRLQEDITEAVLREERAIRVGAVEQLDRLADPEAPSSWRFRYETLFHHPPEDAPVPSVKSIDHRGDRALVTVVYEGEQSEWQALRGYRLVEREWRRSPIPEGEWGPPSVYHASRFTLHISDRDREVLPPEPFLAFLEDFYERFVDRWPVSEGRSVTLRIEPRDLGAPLLAPPDLGNTPPDLGNNEIVLNSPLLANHLLPALPQPQAYRLEAANSIAVLLDRQPASTSREGAALRATLREALVRQLVLGEEAQRAYRSHLLLDASPGTEPNDKRDLLLLIDYLIALEGEEAPARLLKAYRQSVSLEAATVQGFGYPLAGLMEEIDLWQQMAMQDQRGWPAAERAEAVVLRLLSVSPFEAMVFLEDKGRLATLQSEDTVPLPVTGSCLESGSRLSFAIESGAKSERRIAGQDIRVESVGPGYRQNRLAPPESNLFLIRHGGESTKKVSALDGRGDEQSVLTVGGGADPVPHPFRPILAFIEQGDCTSYVNRYLADTNEIISTAVQIRGEGNLFWDAEGNLYLLDDLSQSQHPRWILTPVEGEKAPVTFAVDRSMQWKGVQGYAAESGRYLIATEAGRRYWLPLRQSVDGAAALQPATLDLPAGAKIVTSHPLAPMVLYIRPQGNGTNAAFLYDFERDEHRLIKQGNWIDEHVAWLDRDTVVIITTWETQPGATGVSEIWRSEVGNETTGPIKRGWIKGSIKEIVPCRGDTRFFYRSTESPHRLMEHSVGADTRYRHLQPTDASGRLINCMMLDNQE